jgi:hypothetical protein
MNTSIFFVNRGYHYLMEILLTLDLLSHSNMKFGSSMRICALVNLIQI